LKGREGFGEQPRRIEVVDVAVWFLLILIFSGREKIAT